MPDQSLEDQTTIEWQPWQEIEQGQDQVEPTELRNQIAQ